MRSIKTEHGTIYVSDAEHEQHQLIHRIGWQEYCALMGIEPDPDRKARAARLRSLGFDWQTIADCLQVTVTTLQRWLVESPKSRDKRRETRRRYRRRKTAEQAAKRREKWAQPSELAERLGVTAETVRAWIRSGKLPAVNVSPNKKRPTYRINRKFLDS